MRLEISKRKFTDYTLLYMLVALSGIPFFDGDVLLVGCFGLVVLIFFLRREGIHKFYIFVALAFLTMIFLHGLRFHYIVPYSTIVGLIIKLSLGYFVVVMLKEKFTSYYVNFIYISSIISFFFFIPLLISPAFDNIFSSIALTSPFGGSSRGSLIIYNLNLDRPEGLYRNCGPFWEPAAFGGFLMVAFMMNLARTNSLKDKKSIILLITLISTFSTTVFVVLAFLLFCYFFFNQSLGIKLTIVPIMAIGFYLAFFKIDFLYEKIMLEIEKGDKEENMRAYESAGHSRLSSAIADFKEFSEYPVIGRGLYDPTFFDKSDLKARHNGLSKFIAQFGIIGSLIYFIAMYRSFSKLVFYSCLNSLMRFVFFGVILAIGISEVFYVKPFFWGLIFLHLVLHSEEDVLAHDYVEEQAAVA